MKKITTAFSLAVILCSCSHYYYVPNVQNVPLFREKNEYRFSGTYGLGTETSCLEFQGAYSMFFEPALTIRGGWKYLKVQLQGATASYLNNDKYHFDQYHISIGLNVAISKRYLKDVSK